MKNNIIFLFVSVCLLTGCASIMDAPKALMGFSIRDIEAARAKASVEVYQGSKSDVFDAVIAECGKLKYYVFTKDSIRGFISLMNIPGAVDTTEVGVFVTALPNGNGVKVELSSRSAPARRTVTMALFPRLAERFRKL